MFREKTAVSVIGVGAKLISPLRWYLYFEPEVPRRGVEAVGVKDEIFSAQVELRRPVAEGPGGEAGSTVWHQVQGHVTGACQEHQPLITNDKWPNQTYV